jgi:FHS family L-fucose permease-like MFS transporter
MIKPGVSQGASTVVLPYLALAILLLLVAVFIYFSKINTQVEETTETTKKESIFKKPYVVLGALGIFFYVGAEVAVGSNIVSYLKENYSMEEGIAAAYLSYYWGGAMIGRFLGSVSLSNLKTEKKLLYMLLLAAVGFGVIFVINNSLHALSFDKVWIFLLFVALNFICLYLGKGKPARSLAIFAFVNVCLIILSLSINSPLVIWTLLAIGLFNSIMWSNVFTLAIDGLDEQTSQVSSILIMMIVGGAILPPLQGLLADATNITISFLIPMVSYAYLFFYGIKGFNIGKISSK